MQQMIVFFIVFECFDGCMAGRSLRISHGKGKESFANAASSGRICWDGPAVSSRTARLPFRSLRPVLQ